MASIFVSGFAPTVKSEEIINFLKNKNLDKECSCDKMKTLKDKHRSSFKLVVPYDKREEYLSADLWPKGITVNHFRNLQRLLRVSTQHQGQT